VNPERVQVMLIEDNPGDVRLIRRALSEGPFDVEPFGSLAAGLDRLDRRGIDAVLLDLGLPDSQGFSTFEVLHARVPDLPIIVLTGWEDEGMAVRTVQGGAQDYVLKGELGGRALRRTVRYAVERRSAAAALNQSNARYHDLFHRAVLGMYRTDAAGRFTDVNPAFVALLGYDSAKEVLAQHVYRDLYLTDADRQRVLAVKRENGQVSNLEVQWKRRDGSVITVRLSGSEIRGADGAPEGFEMIAEDVTEQRLLERQFRQAQKMESVGLLAGGVAHDFNNMLSVILGWADLALPGCAPDSEAREALEEVRKAAESAAGLTRQLLAFSRRQVVEPTTFRVDAVLTEMEKMFGRLLGNHVVLETLADPDVGSVRIDRGQLEQVLMNLVVNARDAMPTGGTLRIASASAQLGPEQAGAHPGVVPGAYVAIAVSDTGVGMDEAIRSRIFEPFFTTKPKGQGTGLGLATSHGIVQQAGGFLAVQSELGVGTTMTVYLPLHDATGPSAVRPGRRTPVRDVGTVLVVDDDEAVQRVTTKILERTGFAVVTATSAEEALEVLAARHQEIRLVLSDVVLAEGMSGADLAARIREAYPGLRVLLASGYTSDVTALHGLLEESTAFIQKPFTAESLSQKVRVVLEGL